MAAGFLLATLLALEEPRVSPLKVGLLWFLALLSKESAAVVLLWIPLLGLFRPERFRPSSLVRPLAAMAAAMVVYLAIRAAGAGFHAPLAYSITKGQQTTANGTLR